MKKMIAMILAAGAMSGFAAPTANEDFVVAEDARTYTNAVQAAKVYTDAAVATAARPATRIVTEDGTRFTDATGCVFAVSFGVGRFVVTNLFQMAPGVEFVYTNINPIAWALVDGSSQIKQMAKFMAYDAAVKRWIALGSAFEDITPESIAGFNASFQSVTNTPIDAASFTLYDRGFVGDADHAEGTFYRVAGAPVTSLVDRVVYESGTNAIISASTTYTDHATNNLHKSLSLIITNDVCNIVTNEVPSDGFTEWSFSGFPDGTTNISASFENGVLEVRFNFDGVAFYGVFSGITDETSVEVPCDDYDATASCPITATRTRLTRNALGLARLADLPPLTNGLATASITNDLPNIYQAKLPYATNSIPVSAVSNALSVAEAEAGFTKWTYSGLPVGATVLTSPEWIDMGSEEDPVWLWSFSFSYGDDMYVSEEYDPSTEEDDTLLTLVCIGSQSNITVTATRTRLPTMADLVVIATSATNYTDSAIATTDTSYPRVIGITNINQTVQYVSIDSDVPTTLSIMLPTSGDTKDWIVYVTAQTNVTINLPSATWWLADTSATNDIAPQTPTALYFSQAADGIYTLGRQEFTEVVQP